ncbi:MAG: hypothetical protein WCK60_00330 [Candidatus Nomurabacteria bacterium]
MGKPKIKEDILYKLKLLRESGKSIAEIVNELGLGKGTVGKYCRDIKLNKKAKQVLETKRYPSRRVSLEQKLESREHASKIIKSLNDRDMFLIFSALYWGEGTKSELNIINGDHRLIDFFVKGLISLGIEKKRIKISIRFYSGQNKKELISFWLKLLALDESNIVGFEKVEGNGKTNKLIHGMCRVRVQKSSYYHKLVTSAIEIISSGSSNG